MSICQADDASMVEYRAAHGDHVAAKLEFYAALAVQKASTTAGVGASSSVAGVGPSTSTAPVGPWTVVHDISSGTKMDSDFWESIIVESNEESEDEGFRDD
jgi:hypothetical protein